MYEVKITKKASKQLKNIDNKKDVEKIYNYIEELKKLKNPRSRGKKFYTRYKNTWRYKIGTYRMLCQIFDDKILISIFRIGHRKDVYR